MSIKKNKNLLDKSYSDKTKQELLIRPLGSVLLDMEAILDEMVDDNDLQFGDILYLIYGHLVIHRPDAKEIYTEDKSSPVLYYGHKDGLK